MHQLQDFLHSETLHHLERLFLRELVIFIIICLLLGSFLAYGAAQSLDRPPPPPPKNTAR